MDNKPILAVSSAHIRMTSSWRVMSFFFVVFVLPTLLISVPLYARYQLYPAHDFLATDGDMFALHDTVSPFWCQGQKLSVNGTFESFQTPEPILQRPTHRRETPIRAKLKLEHDDAEEWGFYLVKDSSFIFSSCARWPGATLVVVKGEENLRKCFYREDRLQEELEDAMRRRIAKPLHKIPSEPVTLEDDNNGGEVMDTPGESLADNNENLYVNMVTRKRRESIMNRTDTFDFSAFSSDSLRNPGIGAFAINETIEVFAGNSSFSSSEEFLQQCTETIASIELNPYPNCHDKVKISKESPDRWKFKVNESDYYFFIFASDNTLEQNTIYFKLLLRRSMYNTSNPIAYCSNSTECVFSFPFMSPSGVVVDVRGSYENVSYLSDLHSYEVRSECQPRFIVYTVLILLVPFIIVLFAFR